MNDTEWGPWIKWSGGACPVPKEQLVQVDRLATGKRVGRAEEFEWGRAAAGDLLPAAHGVVAYRFPIDNKPKEKTAALQVQIGGDHYKKLAIQPMQYSMANKLDACQHTIIKYVTRFRDKGGIADLEKAKHTIDMLIEMEQASGK